MRPIIAIKNSDIDAKKRIGELNMGEASEVVVADIGGTHARFAIAKIEEKKPITLNEIVKMRVSEHASLQLAWEAYGQRLERPLPRNGSIAVAGPVGKDVMQLTNSSWMLRPANLADSLKVDRCTLVNDFGAAAHSVAQLNASSFQHICGPNDTLLNDGIVSVIGPGTGLGVAYLRRASGDYDVTQTEGGHIDFAPLDTVEDGLLAGLRNQHRRVSVERIASGPGLQNIYAHLAKLEGKTIAPIPDHQLWKEACDADNALAAAALDRFCMSFGSISGDIALAHGAQNLVITGGLAARIGAKLTTSGFQERFAAKGRFQSHMKAIGVYLLSDDDLGLQGAAAAFAREHIR